MRKSYKSCLKFLIFIFLLLQVGVLTLHAQSNKEKKIKSAIDAVYNFEFEKGEIILNEYISEHPKDPQGYHFKSIKYLWFYLDSKEDKNLHHFLSLSDSAIILSESLLDSLPDNLFYHYILGSTYSYRALAYARAEEYLNALWATKKLYFHLTVATEIDSGYADAYLGLGIYNFAASQSAPAWKWALELTGISGDKKVGFEFLRITAEKGNYSKADAQFYLSQLLAEFLLDYKSAEKILNQLILKFPGNLLFKYALAELLINSVDLTSAEKLLRDVIQSPDSNFYQLKNYSKFSVGNIFFFQNQFDSAKVYYSEFLSSSLDNHFKGIASLRLGLCFYLTNQSIESEKYFADAEIGNLDLDEDRFAKITGEEYLENPPDSIQIKLILAENLIRSGKYKSAKESLLALLSDSVSNRILAQIYLHLSNVSYHQKNYKESLDHAISAFNIESADQWIRAFACYYAARSSYSLKNYIDSKLFIQYSENYNDYIFENRLRKSLYALSVKLNN